MRDIKLRGSRRLGRILQVKIDERSSLGTVGSVTIVRRVEVHIYDLLLGIVASGLRGQNNLFELTDKRILVADDNVFDELLCDRAAAGHDVPFCQI